MNAIEFDHVGKQYRLGLVSTGTFSDDLTRWWTMHVRHKEDPFLKIGETNDRSHKGSSNYVWALKDINFNVEQGDVVGIIGKNGAGKSTLLKLLSRVTAPSVGEIRARGRIASLLEVGTGFHPEMTGRENIYLNGAIMGMTKQEITRKLDEIVDFSGCERYIDTPVKRYSSGMTVRLGFAIAAHLEPEILVVDEVLAVGDAEFQKKAIGKMQDVSKGGGRTVLFVSHNMTSIRHLCNHGVLLENGGVKCVGEVNDVVDKYVESSIDESSLPISKMPRPQRFTDVLHFTDMKFLNENDEEIIPKCGGYVKIRVFYQARQDIKKCILSIGLREISGTTLIDLPSQMTIPPFSCSEGEHYADCIIPKLPLTGGNYRMSLWSECDNGISDYIENIRYTVAEADYYGQGREMPTMFHGKIVLCDHQWICSI
jgi:lipopolysaccharide transport system ATP-binding protein